MLLVQQSRYENSSAPPPTTGDLVARLDSIPDNDIPRDGYQGQLAEDVTAEATRKVIAYFEETLAS